MREIGTLPDVSQARTLAGHLLAHSIETRLEETTTGWIIWVLDEDKVPRGREEFQAFVANPGDGRYQAVVLPPVRPVAPQRRKRRAAAVRSRPTFEVTVLLVCLSVAASAALRAPESRPAVADNLFFLPLDVNDNYDASWKPPASSLPEIRKGEVWRLATPALIHFSPWHLLFDMLWLVALGRQIEQHVGSLRFALMVLFLAVSSNTAQYFFAEINFNGWRPVWTAQPYFGGMSGVVYGLFGFIWMQMMYNPGRGYFVSPIGFAMMIGWFFFCIASPGMTRDIANTAHAVGLMMGMLIGYLSAWYNGWGQKA